MKKKVLPVIVAILLILVIGGCALGKVLLDKYSYSKEEADWNEFYQVSENDRSAIILQNEMVEEQALIKDGVCYFDLATVHKYLNEVFYADMTENLSSCKSPQQMFGAMVKTYFAEKQGIDPKNIVSVSVMPCTAKKFEIGRDHQNAAGVPDVDIAITTRELARLIRRCGIEFTALPDEGFDDPMGESTGAAVIFGATGGVMEAALRTAVETLTGEELANLEFTDVRGTKGIKEAEYQVAGMDIRVAVASGLGNARELLNQVKSGEKQYHFIEIMGCPGGCVNGGGQPQVSGDVRNFTDVRGIRASVLYRNDQAKVIRKSHENPAIKKLYEEYLGEPGSKKAHETLHTTYVKRTVN